MRTPSLMPGKARRPERHGAGEMEEEEREAPTPTLGGETASATPQPAPHSFTDSDKDVAPSRPLKGCRPQPYGATGGGGPLGVRGHAGGGHSTTISAVHPLPQQGRGEGRGGWRDVDDGDTHDLSGF